MKKQVPEKRNGTPQNSSRTKGISKKATTINSKNEDRTKLKVTETVDEDASSEGTEDVVTPSSSLEPETEGVEESEEDAVEKTSSNDEDEEVEEEEEEEEEKETLKSLKEKNKKSSVKNKGEKRSTKEDGESEEEEEEENSSENNLYRFPMNRVSRIIKSELPDIKIAQEAVFVINKASEKFLQVFCREAYACAFLDNKKYTAYNHLSSVVSRRKRLKFLSDYIPEKVKAEDALALISKAEE